MKWIVNLIRIKNFKTYGIDSVVGPIANFNGIYGKNGSGKSNLIDGINFLLGGNLSGINCNSIYDIFPKNYKKTIECEIKVGMLLINNKKKKTLIRIINKNNTSEFFLGGLKVSFNQFFKFLKYIGLENIKDFIIIKNPNTSKIFIDPLYLSSIIDTISGSNKFSLAHLKAAILKKKLQENCIFYYSKIKIIIVEKKNLIYSKKKLFELEKKSKIKSIFKKNIFFLKSFQMIHIVYKTSKKISFLIGEIKEYKFQKKIIRKSSEKSNKVIKYEEINIKTSEILLYISKFNLILIKNYIHTLLIFFEKFLFSNIKRFVSRKKKSTKKIFRENHKAVKIQSLTNNFFYKATSKYEQIFKKENNFFKNLNFLENPFSIEYDFKKKSQFRVVKNRMLLRQKLISKIYCLKKIRYEFFEKIKNCKVFFFTLALVFYLVSKKKTKIGDEKNKKHLKKSNLLQKSNKISSTIRGFFFGLVKPLDSEFKLLLKNIKPEFLNSIVIDKYDSIIRFFDSLSNDFKGTDEFITKNNVPLENTKNLIPSKIFDYDSYDYTVINLIMKKTNFKKFIKAYKGINIKQNLDINKSCISKVDNYDKLNFDIENFRNERKSFGINTKNPEKKKYLAKFFKTKTEDLHKKEKNFSEAIHEEFKNIKKIHTFKKKTENIRIEYFIFLLENKEKTLTNSNFNILKNIFTFKIFFLIKKKLKVCILFKKHFFLERIFEGFGLLFNKFFKIFYGKKNTPINEKSSFKKNFSTTFNKYLNHDKIYWKFCLRIIFQNETILLNIFINRLNSWKNEKINVLFSEKNSIFKKLKANLVNIETVKSNIEGLESLYRQDDFKRSSMFFINKIFFSYLRPDFSRDLKIKEQNLGRKSNFYIFLDFFSRKKYIKHQFSDSRLFKKIDGRNINPNKILNSRLMVRMNIIEKRFFTLKKNLLESRKNFLIIGSKFIKIKMERKNSFLKLFTDISREVNLVYKEITKTLKNPFGGTVFLDLSNKEQPYFGKIFLSSIFPGKNIEEITSLSGGEKTLTSISLFLAFGQILNIPLFFLDEIDLYLDLKFSKKIFEFLIKYSSRNKISMFMVTFKVNFILFFGMLFFVYNENSSSKIFSYTT
jgi:hypothetical protein